MSAATSTIGEMHDSKSGQAAQLTVGWFFYSARQLFR
jgi:hypothetical protein